MQRNFTDFDALNAWIQNREKGFLLITYRHCRNYEGMALCIMLVFDAGKEKYELDLQWMSLGLDLYGDTLQENYVYRFENLEKLLAYLLEKYDIKVSDIRLDYKFDLNKFPNPMKDEAEKPIFEAAWARFQTDFNHGAFLDTSLHLVYNSRDT